MSKYLLTLIYILIIVVIVVLGCFIFSLFKHDDFVDELVMQNIVRKEDIYEFTK